MIRAWHFTSYKLRCGSQIPKIGEWLEHNGEVVICRSGLHASRDPFDALEYAPGPILHLVECDGVVAEDKNKFVCRRRRIIASNDATEGLIHFARMQALSVVHLWDAPDSVLDYLMTGDESAQSDACAAACAAARDAAARDTAAWAAARAAAWAAAWADSKDAAAWDAAWDAACAGAWAASKDVTARGAAWAAARAAARDEWNALVREAFGEYLESP